MKPKVRFKDVDGEWKKIKFSAISSRITRRNSALECKLPLTISASEGLISQEKFFNNIVASSNLSNYYLIRQGEFAYNKSYSNGYPFGAIKRLDKYDSGVLSPLYICFSIDDETDSDYICTFFETTLWHKDIAERATEGARNHGILNIGTEDFFGIDITFPEEKAEQQAIASFFRTLDSKLQASSKKVEALKKLKSASLISMFPQNGESTPKVRFKGFEGEWSKQSASDLFLTIDERNRPELPVLSACQDVRGMIPREKIGFNVSHDTSNEVTYKRVQPGQFVIHLRSFQGGFAHSSYDGIISPAYTVFDFKDKERHDDYYWKIVFMSRSFIDRLRLITYGIRDGRSISFNEFKDLSFQFPSKAEQQAIASFFRTLDRKIALETARLEKLKQIKLACLDKMFV